MLTYNFANIGSDSLYEYLYKCIKNDILLGNIRPGEKLPSKRTFAKNLGISVITVSYTHLAVIQCGNHTFKARRTRKLCRLYGTRHPESALGTRYS